ncbi:MAG: ATP-binding protein [Candidatus Methanomethylicaceae archaeon]
MARHDSGVNFKNLIRDLADMYPYNVAEVVLVEIVANSLDAKAKEVRIDYDPDNKVLIVSDNGIGMTREQFQKYHDFAAGLKEKGFGIGFAGIGAKISFNIADKVVTETRGNEFSAGSYWYFDSSGRLVWEDMDPQNLDGSGTRVAVYFRGNVNIPYSTTDDILRILRSHYLPLFDKKFLELYNKLGFYDEKLRFVINGSTVEPAFLEDELNLKNVEKVKPHDQKGKFFGYGILGIAEKEYPISEEMCGVLISTHGKVVKSDFFNQYPGEIMPRVFGLIEVPELISFLTTSKTDFNRKMNIKKFEALYSPLRQVFKEWLARHGMGSAEDSDSNEARKLEREFRKILEEIPELGAIFEGLTVKKPALVTKKSGEEPAELVDGAQLTFPDGNGEKGLGNRAPTLPGIEEGKSVRPGSADKATPIGRKSRSGPRVSFESNPHRVDIAWVDGNDVVINSGHKAYEKVRRNDFARRAYSIFAAGYAIHRFLEPLEDSRGGQFVNVVDRILDAWGRK